ncbi:hypothetical protein BOX15_Mlig012604g1, partial [Macrostomum lignano]
YPSTRAGSTKIIANELGHLLPGVGRSEGSPWGDFKGTWDLPNRLPGNHLNNTCARRAQPEAEMPPAAESCRKSPCAATAPANCQSNADQKASEQAAPCSPTNAKKSDCGRRDSASQRRACQSGGSQKSGGWCQQPAEDSAAAPAAEEAKTCPCD